MGEIIPAHVSKRLNQEPWQIRFDAHNVRGSQQPPRSLPFSATSNPYSHVGAVDGTLIVNGTYLERSGTWFDDARLPDKLMLYPVSDMQPPTIRAQLEAIDAMPVLSYSLILPRNGRLVYERPLIGIKSNRQNVVAVFQSTSSDGGVTWSEPSVTRQAEIFVLNQPFLAQPFQGRAVRLNGKDVRSGKLWESK